MFRGIYHGKTVHAGDLKHVIHRSQAAGVDKILVTAGNVAEVQQATQLCIQFDKSPNLRLETTAGFHPTRCMELEEDFLKKEPTADEGSLISSVNYKPRIT